MYYEKIVIEHPKGHKKWIKSIDRKKGTIEFTENPDEAFVKEGGGFFVDEEIKHLKFFFMEDYPELKYAKPYGAAEEEMPTWGFPNEYDVTFDHGWTGEDSISETLDEEPPGVPMILG